MRSALVHVETGVVENIIVADPSVDPAPDGYVLIGNPADHVAPGVTTWDQASGFSIRVGSEPQPIEGLEAL